MRVAYLDCFSGVSGNMLLAALLDAGVSRRWLETTVKKVIADFRLHVSRQERGGLSGLHVRVQPLRREERERRLPQISRLLRKSDLPPQVKARSLAVFERLAAAEAKVHGRKVSEVHFHEVGAVDAIVDIVGTVAGFHQLGVQRLICSPLPLCRGQVRCAHGVLPLPAPATLELLNGVPIQGREGEAELVTPTGAALVVTLATNFGPWPLMKLQRLGVGLGDRELDFQPNLLRLAIGEMLSPAEELLQMEAAIDDMSAERFGFLMERLHAAGALEVVFLPAQMKKNRPGTLVRVLLRPEEREAVLKSFFKYSTTLGVRMYAVSRNFLPRKMETVNTKFGPVRVKVSFGGDEDLKFHAEYEDLKAAAVRAGVSLEQVEKEARQVWAKSKAGAGT